MDGEDDFPGFPPAPGGPEDEARRLQMLQEQQRFEQQRLEQQRLEQQRQQQHQQQLPPQQQAQNPEMVMLQMITMMDQMMQRFMAADQRQQQFYQAMAAGGPQAPLNTERILDSLASNMREFQYDSESNVTFAVWYARYEDLFSKDAVRLTDDAKVRLLLRKLGMTEHERYVSFILPQKPSAISFEDTVNRLTSLFGAKQSVVSKRHRCLQVSKLVTEDYTTYGCRINKLCVEFELSHMTEEQFKCLIFVCGLKAEGDAEIRTRLLSKIEERDVTLQQLSEECQRLLNLKHDNEMIEAPPPTTTVSAVQQQDRKQHDRKQQDRKQYGKKTERKASPSPAKSSDSEEDVPSRPCWLCGAMHYTRQCNYKKHKCTDCDKTGHREGYCLSAKPLTKKKKGTKATVTSNVVAVNGCSSKQRRFVSVGFAGKTIVLQLDTASDVTVISKQLWKTIGSPKLLAPSVRMKTASGSSLSLVGEFCCNITIAGSTRPEIVRVAEQPLQLLGADLIDSFGLASMPMDAFCCNAPAEQIDAGREVSGVIGKTPGRSAPVLQTNLLRASALRAVMPFEKVGQRYYTIRPHINEIRGGIQTASLPAHRREPSSLNIGLDGHGLLQPSMLLPLTPVSAVSEPQQPQHLLRRSHRGTRGAHQRRD